MNEPTLRCIKKTIWYTQRRCSGKGMNNYGEERANKDEWSGAGVQSGEQDIKAIIGLPQTFD